MVRKEKLVRKEQSDLKLPKKGIHKKYTRAELDDMIVRLAEAHGMLEREEVSDRYKKRKLINQ